MKLSVIIPVYNVEPTLERCFSSVVSQAGVSMEIILVDDGSTDGSGALADALAATDARVRVVHQPNGGLSRARNTGIAASTGNLLTFVDSDDYLASGTYAPLVDMMSARPDIDMLEYPVMAGAGSADEHLVSWPCAEYTSAADYWLSGCAYRHTYAWNKIFRRNLFCGLTFAEGRIFEDAWTMPSVVARCQTICVTNVGCYFYWLNPNGITATASRDAMTTLLDAHLQALTTLGIEPDGAYYAELLNIQLTVAAGSGAQLLLPYKRIGVSEVEGAAMKFKVLMLNVIGLKRMCSLYRLFVKLTAR